MMTDSFSLARSWNRLSIKYKIVIISASLITLRVFLNGNYYVGYQQLEKYHEFEHHVHWVSYELYNFKSSFTEIYFTNGALPQIAQTRAWMDKAVRTTGELRQKHTDSIEFQERIAALEEQTKNLRVSVEEVLQTPELLNMRSDEGMIILGRITAMTNHLFSESQQLIEDVTVYSGKMRDDIFDYMLSMGMAIFCVGILFLIMLYRGVMGPLKLLEEMRGLIQRVRSEGDLSGRLPGGDNNTEVGRLASDFNGLISTLNTNLGKTSQTVRLVAEHVERLSHEVRESHDEISQQQHEIFHLNNAIRKMSETMQVLAENAEKVAYSSSQLETHCREGEDLLQQIRAISQRLDEHVSSAMGQLEKIQEDSASRDDSAERHTSDTHPTADSTQPANAISQLQYYSKEAANSIKYATTGLDEQRTTLESAGRPSIMIRQLSGGIDECIQIIISSIETEKQMLQTISRDVDEITTLENHAAFTSNLITSASDELLYLSKLLSSEVQRFHTTLETKEETQHAS